MHLKNISLQKLMGNTSHYYDKLTPNYDSLFTEAFENTSPESFLAIDLLESGFSKKYEYYGYYTGYDFIELGSRLNIPERLVKKTIEDITNKMHSMQDVARKSYMPDAMKSNAIQVIGDRTRALSIGINE